LPSRFCIRDACRLTSVYPVGAAFAPPSDPEVRKAVDKLAEFVAKHGRSFEDITKQRNPGESMFK
jgi:splicing factor 4